MSGVIDVCRRVPERLTLLQKLYIPEILRGMAVTLRHLVRNLANMKGMPTIQYPEMRRNYSDRFRGKHILKTREDGTLKCVACYMCQQACPAECITIVAGEHPKIAYEKYPVVFDIDMMRCVFCGFCVDACPKDAIWMTRNYEMAFFTPRGRGLLHRPAARDAGGDRQARLRIPSVLPGRRNDAAVRRVDAAGRCRAAASATGCASEAVPLPDRDPGPGPLNAPSQAQKAFSA